MGEPGVEAAMETVREYQVRKTRERKERKKESIGEEKELRGR